MNARNDVKRPSDQSLGARLVLAAARLRFAAWVDFLVARLLERCATNVEAAQRLFKTDRKPAREVGIGVIKKKGGGMGIASRKKEAAHMAASLTLSQITSVDLVNPQSKALPRTRFNLDFSRTGPDRLI